MPLQSIRLLNANTYLGIWEITETPEALTAALANQTALQSGAPVFSNLSRQRQWLVGRLLTAHLLQKFTLEPVTLLVDAKGKPFFADAEFYLSISHTQQTVAVILSNKYEVGIDIENIHPKVLRVRHKFLAEQELAAVGAHLEKTLVYWCAKETLYKLYGRGQILFKEHLHVQPFELDKQGQFLAGIKLENYCQTFTVHYENKEQYMITYCINYTEEN